MKYLKKFNESTHYTSQKEIEEFCREHEIYIDRIHPDGTVDVRGNLHFYSIEFKRLPIKFGIVTGSFEIKSTGVTTLENCPHTVGGYVDISFNSYLTSLEHGPKSVGSWYRCCFNALESLRGCPEEIHQSFNCNQNRLTTLEGGPKLLGNYFTCENNLLTTLVGGPERFTSHETEKNDFTCSNNRLTDLVGLPLHVTSVRCQNNHLTDFRGCPEELDILMCEYNRLTSFEGFPKRINGFFTIMENYKLVDPTPLRDLQLGGWIGEQFTKTPILRLMRLFYSKQSVDTNLKAFKRFQESLDYNYFRMVGGIPSVIDHRLREALAEFDLEMSDSIEGYAIVDEKLRIISPRVVIDFDKEAFDYEEWLEVEEDPETE